MKGNILLQQRRDAAIARGQANLLPVYVERAENAELWDVDGRRYVDFVGGIAVLNTGHLHPAVRAAVGRQLERFSHAGFGVTPYESAIALAERLNAVAPMNGPNRTMFVTTGAEAVALYREQPADIVLLELRLRDEEGVVVLREILGEFADAKVIAMSSTALALLSEAKRSGAIATLKKPFTGERLVELVDSVLYG